MNWKAELSLAICLSIFAVMALLVIGFVIEIFCCNTLETMTELNDHKTEEDSPRKHVTVSNNSIHAVVLIACSAV